MKSSTVAVLKNSSGRVEFANIIISLRNIYASSCEVVIGYPGLPNVEKELRNGDFVLYETVANGTVERSGPGNLNKPLGGESATVDALTGR